MPHPTKYTFKASLKYKNFALKIVRQIYGTVADFVECSSKTRGLSLI